MTYNGNDFIQATVTSSTNLQLTMVNGLAAVAVVEWQVIDFTGAGVQTGTASLTSVLTTVSSTLTTVNTASTFLVYSYTAPDGTAAGIGEKLVRGRVTSSTGVTFDRDASGPQVDIRW